MQPSPSAACAIMLLLSGPHSGLADGRKLRVGGLAPGGVGVGPPKDSAPLLPFYPEHQPEEEFKLRCTDFLNHVMEKASYDPSLTMQLLPKCKWDAPDCKALQDDLEMRLNALPKPAGAPSGKVSAVQW